MKSIILFIAAAAPLLFSAGCNPVETWGDGLSELEHVYYIGFHKTNINTDYLSYEVAKSGAARWKFGSNATNGTWVNTDDRGVASVPFQFHSERVRSYDAVTKFWLVITGDLIPGTDFNILYNGSTLTPDGNAVYSIVWPQAKKGIQNVNVKRLTDKNGTIKMYVIDPAGGTPDPNKYETSTLNNKAGEYEVRGFSFDFNKVTVSFTD